jgi:hypothetical protein
MKLYHFIWDCYLESIFQKGLIPNFKPTKWALKEARLRSKGKTFLCVDDRREYWYGIYADGWAGDWPGEPVWLEIDMEGLSVQPDQGDENNDYTGDYWTDQVIPPDRIKVYEYVTYAFFLKNPSSIDSLYDCVSAGGDTDSNGSMLAGLLGALHGTGIFPQHLVDGLVEKEEVLAIADQFYATLSPKGS